jgi:hypothetical protein
MLTHPLPVGTRVKLNLPTKYDWYRVLRVRPWVRSDNHQDEWYYTLVAEEWWDTEGKDEDDKFHGAAQTEGSILITAETVYDYLRTEDP